VMCGTRKQTISNIQEIISNENDYIESEYDGNLACGASYNNTSTCSSTMLDDNYTAKNNLKNLPHNNNNKHQINSNELEERRIRQLKRQADYIWLNAVNGVVENDLSAVENFLSKGGNVARALTKTEVELLNRPSAFDVGYTLIHLAIRFHRDELLSRLLAQINSGPSGIKCVFESVAPEIGNDIRRHFGQILRIRKIPFNCSYVNEHATFFLPADIEELPIAIQEQLYDELLDRGISLKFLPIFSLVFEISEAQKQLENPPPALNWSLEITSRLGSRLMVKLTKHFSATCLYFLFIGCII
jgi:ubiquitin thioesterase ZRANB1